jgi:hypothetical protein
MKLSGGSFRKKRKRPRTKRFCNRASQSYRHWPESQAKRPDRGKNE